MIECEKPTKGSERALFISLSNPFFNPGEGRKSFHVAFGPIITGWYRTSCTTEKYKKSLEAKLKLDPSYRLCLVFKLSICVQPKD